MAQPSKAPANAQPQGSDAPLLFLGTGTPPQKGFQGGWGQANFRGMRMTARDSESLNGGMSVFNRPVVDYQQILGNKDASFLAFGGPAFLQGPNDIAQSSPNLVGGSINGGASGAGAQYTTPNGSQAAVQINPGWPPPPRSPAQRNWGTGNSQWNEPGGIPTGKTVASTATVTTLTTYVSLAAGLIAIYFFVFKGRE